MGLETGTVISQLVKTNPAGDDDIEEGDQHLRLIKSVLQTQFPGVSGNGFNIVIVATEAEINSLQNIRENVQVQLDSLEARIVALGG